MCLDDDAVHDNARGHVWKKKTKTTCHVFDGDDQKKPQPDDQGRN